MPTLLSSPPRNARRRRNSNNSVNNNSSNNNNPSSSAAAALTHNNHSQTRWSAAIRAVLQQQNEQSHVVDGLGLAMTQLINQCPEFRYPQQGGRAMATGEQKDETLVLPLEYTFCYPPLLSVHNARVLARYCQQVRQQIQQQFNTVPTRQSMLLWLSSQWALQQQQQGKSSRQTLVATATFLALGTTCIGVCAGYMTLVVAQTTWYGLWGCLLFLVDWRDVTALVPATTWLLKRLEQVWQVVDNRLLGAKRFACREWTTAEFYSPTQKPPTQLSQNNNNSTRQTLWELPPPTIKLLGKRLALNPTHLQRPQWSNDTVQHVLAIDFCYIMLREHDLMNHTNHRLVRNNKRNYHRSASAPSNHHHHHDDVDVLVHTNRQMSMEAIELRVSTSRDDEFDEDDDEQQDHSPHHESSDAESSQPNEACNRLMESCEASINSSSSDVVSELPWLDVGAKIGLRFLNSAHIHRAMASQETTERLYASSKDLLILDNPMGQSAEQASLPEIVSPSRLVAGGSGAVLKRKPVHPLWTSPTAAAMSPLAADDGHSPLWSNSPPASPPHSRPTSPDRLLPPKSPPLSTSSSSTWQQQRAFLTYSNNKSLPRRRSEEDFLQLERRRYIPNTNNNNTNNMPSSEPRPTAIGRRRRIRPPLAPGIRVAVPITPLQPWHRHSQLKLSKQYQMGSVVRSERIWVRDLEHQSSLTPNCLSVTVKLERSFLRNGEFADLTFRVMDHWPDRYMPKHSKVPIGSCVATTFGIGVLIGWRVEDDCHIVRSLWRRRGPGSAEAYLNRNAIHGVVEAAIGFSVETRFGTGQVLAYTDGGPRFEYGRFLVHMVPEGQELAIARKDIYSCHGAQFIPVIEHIRAAANFQLQLDVYRDSVRYDEEEALALLVSPNSSETLAELSEIVWTSFCKAVDEDKDFDRGVNEFMTSVIEFLERLDGQDGREEEDSASVVSHNDFAVECVAHNGSHEGKPTAPVQEPGFWFTNDILGGVFGTSATADTEPEKDRSEIPPPVMPSPTQADHEARNRHFDRVHAFLRTLMKTVSYARVACVDKTHFRLGLAIVYDVLLFIRTIVKVQQKNVSVHSLRIWKRAFEEIWSTVEPIKDRLQRIGRGIAQRMEQQGKKAKAKVIKFVDTVLGDERLLIGLEQGDWDQCVKQLEAALIHSKILERENLVYYRKTLTFLYNHVRLTLSNNQGAARRNSEKVAFLAKVIQLVASPRRSLLKLFERDDVLDVFERILVRVFHKEELASRKVVIHALNFHSLRHLRMLKDFSTSGRLWMPVLDAADEEFSYMVSHLPQNTKDIMCPISSLFSLCVAQFHKIAQGDLTKDWMDFLLEDDAVRIIHDIDMKLILALEALSRDVKEMMVVLPYYSNIDDDILNLMDEVDLDEFLKEASDAMDDPEKLTQFIREKATIAVQRFLDWLPKISIPVEKRDLMEGWVLTCRGENGGDLTLSDVSVKKENLVCQIMGGDALFFPMFADEFDDEALLDDGVVDSPRNGVSSTVIEESVLDHIREMLLQAERFGCWEAGVGGVGQPPTDRYVASVLQGLPVSTVLNCAIEMWRNLEIDDDELLEIAIKDVSYQIQLQKMRDDKENGKGDSEDSGETELLPPSFSGSSVEVRINESSSSTEAARQRFNPRIDPTVLYLDMKNLTLRLDNFMFRIEKNERRTLLDPVFEGKGSLTIQNISIRVRVECAKERIQKTALGETFAPVLVLKELETSLEQVILRVRDTAFGSDWLVNKAVHAFGDDITKVVEENLREQVQQQAKAALDSLNAYFLVNPNMLLNLLGISMEDLDNNVLWV